MFELTEEGSVNTANIKVIGVGGGGGNAVNTMISSRLGGVDFVAANTDAQSLRASLATAKIQLGMELTRGRGAGSDPELGRKAAMEARDLIRDHLEGADMIFITAGLGGGTGTGGAPIIAEVSKELGALTVAVVTKPFQFEGKKRSTQAEEGIEALRQVVDALIIVPNQRLLGLGGRNLSLLEAFKKVDDVLFHAVKGISDLILVHGIVNVDFADVRTIMSEKGLALMGTGIASGENRAVEAAQRAISSPLLEDNTIQGARGILLNITGGATMSLPEINEASSLIQREAHEEANIIFGVVVDEAMEEEIRITVIATGFEDAAQRKAVAANVTPLSGYRNNLNIPAFLRKKMNEAPGEFKAAMAVGDEDGGNLEIPAFLRRQAD